MKVLTDSGLTTFWNKIKSYVSGSTFNASQIKLSSGKTVQSFSDDTSNYHTTNDTNIKNINTHLSNTDGEITSAKSRLDAQETFKAQQTQKNTQLDTNMANLNTRDDQIDKAIKTIAATGGASTADAVTYDKSNSGLVAATVQGAIDELGKKQTITKYYFGTSVATDKGAHNIQFASNKITFKPLVSMRRLSGESDTDIDITEEFKKIQYWVTANNDGTITYEFNNTNNANFTVYRTSLGAYKVTNNNYNVPAGCEIVLHIGLNANGYYFQGGAAATWQLAYINWENGSLINTIVANQFNTVSKAWVLPQKKITLLHFSDIHGDESNFKKIVQYAKHCNTELTDIICTGDIVNLEYDDGIDWWKNNIGDVKILMALGNHDSLDMGSSEYWFAKNSTECYNRYFSPFIEKWGCNYTKNLCYYYKDYTKASVRLIVLDGMRWNNTKTDDAQKNWFKSTLDDAKNKSLQVIVASHFPPDVSVGNKEVNFDCWYSDNVWEREQYGILNSNVADMINTFQSNGGTFICYIGGHAHGDLFRPLKRYPNQLMVVVANSSCYGNVNNADCFYARSIYDYSGELYNLLNIDTENKILSIKRIGCNFDRYARHFSTITFDYANHKVISQY